MSNPYSSLPQSAFWKPAVGARDWSEIEGLWSPKFRFLPKHKVSTFGSCFAQHFGRALKKRGYHWYDAEPAPDVASTELAEKYNYGVFSARTGNIYTASALRQWAAWAGGKETPPEEIWERNGRFFDPFRPAIEPDGFASAEEALRSRNATIDAFGRAVKDADIFVFTMGLTESWVNRDGGYVYAMCPGTIAGDFDEKSHEFVNEGYTKILRDMRAAIALLRGLNPKIRILLTVSPVPLTATASGNHVLIATTYSKSVLRAVAGQLAETQKRLDYFPSYEIITAPPFGGRFFLANKRSVAQEGVDFVMSSFFACQGAAFGKVKTQRRIAKSRSEAPAEDEDDLVCEEQMLEAFAG